MGDVFRAGYRDFGRKFPGASFGDVDLGAGDESFRVDEMCSKVFYADQVLDEGKW
jgi:hypothetical protein